MSMAVSYSYLCGLVDYNNVRNWEFTRVSLQVEYIAFKDDNGWMN